MVTPTTQKRKRARTNKQLPKTAPTSAIDNLPEHLVLAHIVSRLNLKDQAALGTMAKRFKPVRDAALNDQKDKAGEVRALATAAARILKNAGRLVSLDRVRRLHAVAQKVAPRFGLTTRARTNDVHVLGKRFMAQIHSYGDVLDIDIYPRNGELGYLYASMYLARGTAKWRVELEKPRIPAILVEAMAEGIGQVYGVRNVKVATV